ncbi:hypothetical protein M9458_027364, partial [Cirrhinus mrigala]
PRTTGQDGRLTLAKMVSSPESPAKMEVMDIMDMALLLGFTAPIVSPESPTYPLVPSSPPVPVPPERPPVYAPPERPLEPNCLVHHGFLCSLIHHGSPNCLLRHGPKLPDPPWLPELPDPPWRTSLIPSCFSPAVASRAFLCV